MFNEFRVYHDWRILQVSVKIIEELLRVDHNGN